MPVQDGLTTQIIPHAEISLGKCWGTTTDDIGYSFYKKKFITDGTISPVEGNIVRFPTALTDLENDDQAIILQDHVSVGDTVEIVLHEPGTYKVNPKIKYVMSFKADPDCTGPYNLIAQKIEGNYNNVLVAGSNCLIAVQFLIGDKVDDTSTVQIIGTYIDATIGSYALIEDTVGVETLCAVRKGDGKQIGFKANDDTVTIHNVFKSLNIMQAGELTISYSPVIMSPSLPNQPINIEEESYPWHDRNMYGVIGAAPIISSVQLEDKTLLTDGWDRVFVKSNEECVYARNPEYIEIVDATDHANAALVQGANTASYISYKSGDDTKLSNFVVETVRKLFGVASEEDVYDIHAAYTTIEGVKSASIVPEPPVKELLATILFDDVIDGVKINESTIHIPVIEYIDIPYMQDTVENLIKWQKAPVIVGKSSKSLKELGTDNLHIFASLLETGWFRVRSSDKISAWTVSPDSNSTAKKYVVWDQEDAIVSVYDEAGVQLFQTALGMTGFHTAVFDTYDEDIYGKLTVKNLPVDVGKNIFIKNDKVLDFIGKSTIEPLNDDIPNVPDTRVTIYSYFEKGGPCYLPDLNGWEADLEKANISLLLKTQEKEELEALDTEEIDKEDLTEEEREVLETRKNQLESLIVEIEELQKLATTYTKNIEGYNNYWDCCKQVDTLAPEVCRFSSFRWGLENNVIDDWDCSYSGIKRYVTTVLDNPETDVNMLDTLKAAQSIIDNIEYVLRGTGDESYFGKGVPYYTRKYIENNTTTGGEDYSAYKDLYAQITALNVRQPSHYHNMIQSAKVLLTATDVHIYGEIEYPELYTLREDLTNKYAMMYRSVYGFNNPDTVATAQARWSAENADAMVADAVEEVIEEIKTSYSNFYSGSLSEIEGAGVTRKNFMIRIPLEDSGTVPAGVVFAQPIPEQLNIKALTTDGNNLIAICEDGKYNLGAGAAPSLSAEMLEEGRVNTSDIELFDAVKYSNCIALNSFNLVNTSEGNVIAVDSTWSEVAIDNQYVSKITDVGVDYIRLSGNILPSQIESLQDVTILVEDLIKDNHKGFYYPKDVLPITVQPAENVKDNTWDLLSWIPAAKTLMPVSSKKYAEFATYENVSSVTIADKKPLVFGNQTLTYTDGTTTNFHMYPIYDDIDPVLRKDFYEEVNGELQYLKNTYGRYIYRVSNMRDPEGGQIYYEPTHPTDHVGVENNIQVSLKNYEILSIEDIDENDVPKEIRDINPDLKDTGLPVPVDEIILKPNTFDPQKYFGIQYIGNTTAALSITGTSTAVSLQKIPAIKSGASTITRYKPYHLQAQNVSGILDLHNGYATVHLDDAIVFPDTVFVNNINNKVLVKELVYENMQQIKQYIGDFLQIALNTLTTTDNYVETVILAQFEELNTISSKATLEDESFEENVIAGVISSMQYWAISSDIAVIKVATSTGLLGQYEYLAINGGVTLKDVINSQVKILQTWLQHNTIVDDYYYIYNMNLIINNPTTTLPVLKPITEYGISNTEFAQTLLTNNTEIVIPVWGYGQRLIGEYTTPSQCAFEDGIFFNTTGPQLTNQIGDFVQLVQFDPVTRSCTVLEKTVPNLTYKSFREATLKLNEDLPLKDSDTKLQMEPVLINLENFNKSENIFSTQMKKNLPDFGKNINTYDLYLTDLKISCKMLYSEVGMDASKHVVNLSDERFYKFGEETLKDTVGYTRVYNNSNPVPNGILYRDVNNDYVYTNTIYNADPDKYFAFEDGSLGKINKYGEVDRYGVTDWIHAISDKDVLDKYRQLDNIFTDFKMIEGQTVSIYNIDKFLNISHRYMNFGLDKSKFTIAEHDDYKTFLLKLPVEELSNVYLYHYLKKKEDTFNGGLKESIFFSKINTNDENKVMLSVAYSTIFKDYNMVYLKDKAGNLVSKVYFRNPIDKDSLMIFTKVN